MSNPFIGEIILFAGNFAPLNYLQCHGQTLKISHNDALYGLLGTTYGGNPDKDEFVMPDLSGRAIVGQGKGNGLSDYVLGQKGGEEWVGLTGQHMPTHSHNVVTVGPGTQNTPTSKSFIAQETVAFTVYTYIPYGGVQQPTTLAPNSVTSFGDGIPHENVQPVLALNYCIALSGTYPQFPPSS